MTESPIDMTQLHRIPACTADACQSGKRACPCPEACGLPLPEVGPLTWRESVVLWTVVGSAALCIVIAGIVGLGALLALAIY